MTKNLLMLSLIASLSACGGSSDKGSTPDVVNTPATFSGDSTGNVVEDGVTGAAGTLTVTDPDSGEASLIAQTNTSGSYGSFAVSAAGAWTYTLDNANADVQALAADDSLTENMTVASADNTSHTVVITINGSDDTPIIGSGVGVDSGTIDINSAEPLTGTLTISGGDAGENSFVAQTDTLGTYGTFSITDTGTWTYKLNAQANKIAANSGGKSTNAKTILESSEELTDNLDVFPVEASDGSMHDVVIFVSGDIDGGEGETDGGLVKGEIGSNDTVPDINCTSTVNSTSALEDAVSFEMTPGETVCLAAGEYSGLDLEFGGTGSEEQPITVAAAVPGEVVISGEVAVALTGEYVVLQGFIFKDGSVDNSIIQTRANSSTPCNNCRITENSLINMDEGLEDTSKWVYIYGANNRIDHNWFSGKTTRGALLAVDRYVSDDVEVDENFEVDRAQIDHNYFGDRPPVNGKAYAAGDDNEYEGIRLGTSDSHTSDSYSVVEHNYFEGIQGEAEVISNKSGNNIIRHNTIRDSKGSIVTRHGEYATIENNFIFGDDNPFSGGIRLVDGNHTVTNNYIEGARDKASNWNGGIVLTSGNGSTSNGYQNVENVLIAYNTIVDSVNSLNVFGGKENTNPDTIYFVNNIITDAIGPVIKNAGDMPTNSIYAGNVVYGQGFSDDDDVTSLGGMSYVDAMLAKDEQGLYRPSDNSPGLSADTNPAIGDYNLSTVDMDGQTRTESTIAGADETLNTAITRGALTSALIGPIHYTPPATVGHVVKVDIVNHDFDSGDFTGWTNTDAEISTDAAEIFSRGKSLKVDSVNDNVSQIVSIEPNTNYTFSAFVKGGGLLVAAVGDDVYQTSQSASDYKFTTVSFNSGSNTLVTLSAKLNDNVANKAPLLNPKFDGKDYDNWTFFEGTGIGQVQDSSNSSDSSDGSVKFKYNDDDSGTPHDPYIAQTLAVEPNTEYTLSMYVLLKSSHTGSSVVFGAFAEDERTTISSATVLASKDAIYADLKSAGAPKGDDSFLQDTVTINTGDNTSLTVFAQYKSSTGDEIRVDEFELSYIGTPSEGSEAYFDSFRLVSHASLEQ